MDFVAAARRIGDRKDETFFAGNAMGRMIFFIAIPVV
jgi:hypothetical protein